MDSVFSQSAALFFDGSAHAEAVAEAMRVHEESMAQANRLHEEGLRITAAQAIEQTAQRIEIFKCSTLHKKTFEQREERYDLWQQRNEATQTIMVVSTVAFVCAYSLIVDGLNQWQDIVAEHPRISVVYGILASSSLFLLLVSFSLCLLLYSRMENYKPLHRYSFCTPARCGGPHATFSSFYYHHCFPLERALSVFFYSGVCTTLGGLITYQLPKHLYVYVHPEMAAIFITVVAIGIGWPLIGRFAWPYRTWVAKTNPTIRM